MKYKVITLNNGEFAVSAGRGNYFTRTVTPNREEAERSALIRSCQWYQEQAEAAWNELVEKHGDEYGRVHHGDGRYDSMSEMMC